ncbi:DUF839 domain-containing protein [Neisseriaceae bacterium TC5R-5]|nr:DUF839 domain-containing protein [Neisseriaceae bacterium TC5R-5]
MPNTTSLSRRHAMKLLAGAPMLPLAATASSLLLASCGSDAASSTGGNNNNLAALKFESATFTGMPAPTLTNPAAMATTTVGSSLAVKFSSGQQQTYALGYQAFFITGDLVPDGKGGTVLSGGYFDINNQPILDTTLPSKTRQFFSDAPDGTSLLKIDGAKVDGVKGNTVFAVVQFEYTTLAQDGKTGMYGKLPSPIAVLTLDQDPATGKLSLVKYHNVDTSAVHGLWITCGASLSPWNTHLSSEEYEPDAFNAPTDVMFQAYSKNLYGNANTAKAYHYGHMPEVTVNPDGSGSIKKHYCMGRISHELVQVMPDQRTALMGDDATNGGLFVFVADKAQDLSAGTLYVAKIAADPALDLDPSKPAVTLSWIKLGHANSDEIKALADTLQPSDILTRVTTNPNDPSYTAIAISGKKEWIKIKPGMEKAAAFLETHRYAAYVGASMGFTKLEGTTVNIKDKIAYSALQNVEGSMVTGNAANVPGNGISVAKEIKAGAILAHTLTGGLQDSSGAPIDSDWMPSASHTLLLGQDYRDSTGALMGDALGNTANPDYIANPDNLKFSETMRTLFIGEDSSQHVNNFLWAYNVDTQQLSRLMSVPAGGESTGLHAVDQINGWTYIMSNFQHAGDWGGIHNNVKNTLNVYIQNNYKGGYGAAVGYLTGNPTQPKLSS